MHLRRRAQRNGRKLTAPAVALTPRNDHSPGAGASAGALLELAARDDFHRWEAQLAATGHCASPIRLAGRIDAIDRATGQARTMYDTDTEPGQVLLIACGNRREHVCPACSQVYKNDARQIIRSGLTGGKGIPETVAAHPCVFATLTAPGFGPVHTTRTGKRGQLAALPTPPRRQPAALPARPRHLLPRRHQPDDPRLGQPMCPDCYDYTGHVLFNACAPELWRRFTIYLPRQLARLTGVTQKHLRTQVTVRFVKVAEYQARGIIHYHAIIRLDAPGDDYQPPPARYDTALLKQAIRQAAAVVSSTSPLTCQARHPRRRRPRRHERRTCHRPGPAAYAPIRDPGRHPDHPPGWRPARNRQRTICPGRGELHRQIRHQDHRRPRPARPARPRPRRHRRPALRRSLQAAHLYLLGTGQAPRRRRARRSTGGPTCSATAATSSPNPAATPSPSPQLRQARIDHRRAERHPDGEKDPWGRDLDEHTVLLIYRLAIRRNRPRHHRRTPARPRRRRARPRARPHRTRGDLHDTDHSKGNRPHGQAALPAQGSRRRARHQQDQPLRT